MHKARNPAPAFHPASIAGHCSPGSADREIAPENNPGPFVAYTKVTFFICKNKPWNSL